MYKWRKFSTEEDARKCFRLMCIYNDLDTISKGCGIRKFNKRIVWLRDFGAKK